MTLTSFLQQNYLREKRLQFIRTHQVAFDVEPLFPLPLFEDLVSELEGSYSLEQSCKIESDILHAGRFLIISNTASDGLNLLSRSLKFLDSIENRVGISINRELIHVFLKTNGFPEKVIASTVGIDLRPTIKDSSVKIHIVIDKDSIGLIEKSIYLDGSKYSDELTEMLLKDTYMIGFDFFLDGRSEIEIYAAISEEVNRQPHLPQCGRGYFLKKYMQDNFSQRVSSLIAAANVFMIGFSRANKEPVLYFGFYDFMDLFKHFTFNDLADRVCNFCQHQDRIYLTWVGVTASELEKDRLESSRIYFRIYTKIFC